MRFNRRFHSGRKPAPLTRYTQIASKRNGTAGISDPHISFRSKNDKICAELLSELGFKFIYEPLLLLRGRQYRPDFYLPEFGLFLEICGMRYQPFYDDRANFKEKVYKKSGVDTIFINHNGRGSLRKKIIKALKEANVINDIE